MTNLSINSEFYEEFDFLKKRKKTLRESLVILEQLNYQFARCKDPKKQQHILKIIDIHTKYIDRVRFVIHEENQETLHKLDKIANANDSNAIKDTTLSFQKWKSQISTNKY